MLKKKGQEREQNRARVCSVILQSAIAPSAKPDAQPSNSRAVCVTLRDSHKQTDVMSKQFLENLTH